MTCWKVREYLFAFLDNELDVPLSIELQLHLEQCHICAREAEIERTIRKQLVCVLDTGGVAPPLKMHALERAIKQEAVQSLLRRSWLRRTLLAACLAIALAAGVKTYFSGQDTHLAPGQPTFAAQIVNDFIHFLEEGQSIQFASSDDQAVADWLRAETDLEVVLPGKENSYGRLLGGRRCQIDGRSAAFAFYQVGGNSASLVIMAGERTNLEDMQEVTHGQERHWVYRRKGYTVVACRRGDLIYAAAGTLSEQELVQLMPRSSL